MHVEAVDRAAGVVEYIVHSDEEFDLLLVFGCLRVGFGVGLVLDSISEHSDAVAAPEAVEVLLDESFSGGVCATVPYQADERSAG